MKMVNANIPNNSGSITGKVQVLDDALRTEIRWLQSVHQNIVDASTNYNISWAAYHASLLPPQDPTSAISVIMPLFPDESKSAAMIRHSMDVIRRSVQQVNPGQVPVITCDQPLYTIAKQSQCT